MRVAGVELLDRVPVTGGDICTACTALTSGGTAVFAKTLAGAPHGFFAAEARGLDWIRVPGGPPVPRVVAVADDGLVLQRVPTTTPSVAAARAFGRRLARLHATGAPAFGAADDGFIATLPLPNAAAEDWPTFYVEQRLRPYLDALTATQRWSVDALCARIQAVCGPAEPPARIHGDLWSGNVVWSADGGWLVDAASAHGGHRETDLAMLALFGAPHLDAVLTAYDDAAPLAEGWRDRVPLHQLHPLLVHATLFGGGYGERAATIAQRLVDAAR